MKKNEIIFLEIILQKNNLTGSYAISIIIIMNIKYLNNNNYICVCILSFANIWFH